MFDFTNSEGNTDYAPYLTAFGGGMKALGTIQAGKASANLMNANAAIAGDQSRSTIQAGAEQAELLRQTFAQKMGRQVASVGGSGLTMSGSPLRAIENTASFNARDIAQTQLNASRKAWGYDIQQQGDLYKAREDKAATINNTLGGLITTGARAYGQWQSD